MIKQNKSVMGITLAVAALLLVALALRYVPVGDNMLFAAVRR